MRDQEKTIANFIQTLVRAIELSEYAHDYAPEHLAITLHRDYDAEKTCLRIECDGTAVEFDPEHQRLDNIFGDLRIKEA